MNHRSIATALLAAAFATVAVSPTAARAGSSASQGAPAATSAKADGEVRRIDKAQGKLTLKHGPIANLDMPGMTMVFKVTDPKMLEAVKEGDKVRFSAERIDGAITVTAIDVAN